jgi:hypothetical protein
MVDFFTKPFATTIFCDDIRPELGGKFSYMGVYFGVMYVRKFPITLPKFCLAVTFYEPKELTERREVPVVVKIYFPNAGDEPSIVGELGPPGKEALGLLPPSELPAEPDVPQLTIAHSIFMHSPFSVQEPGRIRVRCQYPDGTAIKAGSLRIEHQPQSISDLATSPEPPSEQSLTAAEKSSSPPEPSRPARPIRRRRS